MSLCLLIKLWQFCLVDVNMFGPAFHPWLQLLSHVVCRSNRLQQLNTAKAGLQPAAVFISCRSYHSGSELIISCQLLSFETSEYTMTVMSRWGLTSRKPYRLATQYCVNCGPSVGQCLDPFSSRWRQFLVLSRLDYGSATLVGVSSHLLSRLQSVMNTAARLIAYAVLVYKCLHGSAPDELVADVEARQRLRSSSCSSPLRTATASFKPHCTMFQWPLFW